MNKEQVTQDLLMIVEEFNQKFQKFNQETGFTSNFQLNYQLQQKQLEIQTIDYIVFRKEPPEVFKGWRS